MNRSHRSFQMAIRPRPASSRDTHSTQQSIGRGREILGFLQMNAFEYGQQSSYITSSMLTQRWRVDHGWILNYYFNPSTFHTFTAASAPADAILVPCAIQATPLTPSL